MNSSFKRSFKNFTAKTLGQYVQILSVKYHFFCSISGFFVMLAIVLQLLSGVLLAFSLIPEPMIIPIARDEEDLDDLYTDDFFWLHERGVDVIFIFSYFHLLRKLYICVFYGEQEFAWKSGTLSFLIFQVVTFLGLVLCCTHLSDITLTIACNIMHTFFFFTGKVYWWIFTDKKLNCDTLVRLAYAHYLLAFYLFFLSCFHAVDMHYDWKADFSSDALNQELYWLDEALLNELKSFGWMLVLIFLVGVMFFTEPEALSYEIFMWGDVGHIVDVRYIGVAPHWYFRPFMAWLIVCPHHKTGIFGLLYFMIIIFFQVNLKSNQDFMLATENSALVNTAKGVRFISRKNYIEFNYLYQLHYWLFIMSLLYCTTFLPYGRFYNQLGGNNGMLISYFYILYYLTFYNISYDMFFLNITKNIYHRVFCF